MTRVVIATLCLAVHGCDTVNVTGGAVELSWKLRPASSSRDEKFVDCDWGGARPVSQIRLHWEVDNDDEDPDANTGSKAWLCEFNHGVTGFDLPEGTAKLWVTPECDDGPADPATYVAPAIVQRNVSRGATVNLGAVELVVAVSYCNPSEGRPAERCICSSPESREAARSLARDLP